MHRIAPAQHRTGNSRPGDRIQLRDRRPQARHQTHATKIFLLRTPSFPTAARTSNPSRCRTTAAAHAPQQETAPVRIAARHPCQRNGQLAPSGPLALAFPAMVSALRVQPLASVLVQLLGIALAGTLPVFFLECVAGAERGGHADRGGRSTCMPGLRGAGWAGTGRSASPVRGGGRGCSGDMQRMPTG